ncbi:hypothetical protein J007_02627 [Cryptococcus neoformans]|nr:hypothetical protein J007_02627 [Cryptococcus neoformans var. grubii]
MHLQVDYLNSIVREKKKAEVKKKTEARMKNVKGRTMRFRVWLISNWKDTPLDGCKERDLLKWALLSERGVLWNLHFLEHNETEDVLKRVAERRSNSAGDNEDEDDDDAYDEFLLLADAYYGSKVEKPGWVAIEPWWWSPVIRLAVWAGYESWLQAQDKAKRRSTPVFHLPYKYHHTITMSFCLTSSPTSLEEMPDGLFHPTAEYTRGMINWEAVQKMDSSFIPTYEDVPPDPTRSQSTQGHHPLLEILRHHHPSVYARLQKRLVLLPGLESYTLRSLWKSQCGEGTTQYESKLQRAIVDVCYSNFSEYLDASPGPVLDSCHEMEEMDFDFTQENEVFGNFNGFVTEEGAEEGMEEGVEEGGSSIEEVAM